MDITIRFVLHVAYVSSCKCEVYAKILIRIEMTVYSFYIRFYGITKYKISYYKSCERILIWAGLVATFVRFLLCMRYKTLCFRYH